jgi:hypothetical protein
MTSRVRSRSSFYGIELSTRRVHLAGVSDAKGAGGIPLDPRWQLMRACGPNLER